MFAHSLSLSLSNLCLTSTSTFKWYEISSFFIRIQADLRHNAHVLHQHVAFRWDHGALLGVPDSIIGGHQQPPEAIIFFAIPKGSQPKRTCKCYFFSIVFFLLTVVELLFGLWGVPKVSSDWNINGTIGSFPSHFNIRIHWMHQQPCKTTRCAEVKSS